MATFSITVKDTLPKNKKPYILSETYIENDCKTEVDIFVPVDVGQTRYVTLTYVNASSNTTQTINTDTTFKLLLDFNRSEQESLNIEFSSATIDVKLSPASNTLFSKQITRTHTGNVC